MFLGSTLHGRYTIERLLDRSEFGDLYLAHDQRTGHSVAIKHVARAAPNLEGQFEADTSALAALSHPAIPAVVERFAEQGAHYLVAEHPPGDTLEALRAARPHGRLPAQAAILAALALLDALAHCHSRTPPLLHRDIRPANVYVAPDGGLTLTNFGIVAIGYARQETSFYGIGTPGFAPPEQHLVDLDTRSDLYAVGATLYALLTGAPPPPAADRQRADTLAPAEQLAPTLPALGSALLRLLALDRKARFADARAARQALADALPPQLCPSCGAASRGTAKFCTKCGTTLPMADPPAAFLQALGSPEPGAIAPPQPPAPPAAAPARPGDITAPLGAATLTPDDATARLTTPAAAPDDATARLVSPALAPDDATARLVSPALTPDDATARLTTPALAPDDATARLVTPASFLDEDATARLSAASPSDGDQTMLYAPAGASDSQDAPTTRFGGGVTAEQAGAAAVAQAGAAPRRNRLLLPIVAGLLLLLLVCAGGAWAAGRMAPALLGSGSGDSQATPAGGTAAALAVAAPTAEPDASPSPAPTRAQPTLALPTSRPTIAPIVVIDTVLPPTEPAAAPTETPIPPTETPAPPTSTPPPPTSTPQPTAPPGRLSFVKASANEDPSCISVQIRGITARGWTFKVDGLNVRGAFDGVNARACGLSAFQEFTFTVFDARGRPTRGGQGIPARGGDIMIGTWGS